VNVSSMAINAALRASDIVLKEGTELVSDPRLVISHVVSTRTSDAAAAEAAGAEPEVIKKGKKEEAAKGAAPAKAAAPAAKAPAAKKK